MVNSESLTFTVSLFSTILKAFLPLEIHVPVPNCYSCVYLWFWWLLCNVSMCLWSPLGRKVSHLSLQDSKAPRLLLICTSDVAFWRACSDWAVVHMAAWWWTGYATLHHQNGDSNEDHWTWAFGTEPIFALARHDIIMTGMFPLAPMALNEAIYRSHPCLWHLPCLILQYSDPFLSRFSLRLSSPSLLFYRVVKSPFNVSH